MEHPCFKLPWPETVDILEPEQVGTEVSGPPGSKQCLWGHLNNVFRPYHEISVREIGLMTDVWIGLMAQVCNILHKSKDHALGPRESQRGDALRNPYASYKYQAFAFNAAWAALGYTEGQDEAVIKVGTKAWTQWLSTSSQGLSKSTPGSLNKTPNSSPSQPTRRFPPQQSSLPGKKTKKGSTEQSRPISTPKKKMRFPPNRPRSKGSKRS